MAGTRLAIQTVVLVHLLALIAVSFRHGFCRTGCPKGNLTKDLPRVPGGAAAAVEAQWWEELVCDPMGTLSSALGEDGSKSDGDSDEESAAAEAEEAFGSDYLSGRRRLAMTLAFETTVTDRPLWIDRVSKELEESDPASTFSRLLRANPMDLRFLPPHPEENDGGGGGDVDPFARWSHFRDLVDTTTTTTSGRDDYGAEEHRRHRLVVYVPAVASNGVVPDDEAILWRAFDAIPGRSDGETVPGVATLVLPHNTSSPDDSSSSPPPSLSKLRPLVEDWMARAIQSDEERNRTPRGSPPRTRTRTRLTREFPLEHFMAVVMPLLFPLLLPMLVSWIKEFKRYRRLTAAKRQRPAVPATPKTD